jgi:LysM repeat protein
MADNPYSFSNLLTPFKPLFSGLVSPTIPTLPKPAAPSPSPAVTPASNMSVAPTPAVPNINYTPMPAPAPVGGGSYTVASGDTLSAIAARNKISLSELLNLNPQFRANPNLIKPGQTVTLKGAPAPAQTFNTQPKPATPGTITTPSGAVVNPSTGGLVTPPPGSPAVPEVPGAPATPPGPLANPLFTSPEYEAAAKAYEGALPLTPEEVSNQEAINNLDASIRTGTTGEANRPIPLPFITGRQKAIEQRGLALEQPLQAKAALLQAKRTAVLEASKFKLDQEAGKLSALREASKPVSVAMGSSLVNPLTGKTVASGGSYTDKQAYDTFFNLTQTYPDAQVTWDDAKTPQQNLQAAQKAAEASPSFQAKQTVYAINPLTGEPTIINKRTGGGAFGGGTPAGGGITTNNLAPELKSALTSVSGVKFFDASKVTTAQLPYLQRAAQEMGLPLLSKEDANKVQESLQSFSSASALVQQIVNLTSNVLTAPDNAGAQTVQAARLKAIELAPSLSTDNNAKQFISARNSVLSLLTRAAGEKGVLTNQDIARIAQALPSYSDSSTLAAQKAANFSSVLQSVLTGALNAYIGTTSGGVDAGTGGGAGNDPLGLF